MRTGAHHGPLLHLGIAKMPRELVMAIPGGTEELSIIHFVVAFPSLTPAPPPFSAMNAKPNARGSNLHQPPPPNGPGKSRFRLVRRRVGLSASRRSW
jgi:hypothetical protein